MVQQIWEAASVTRTGAPYATQKFLRHSMRRFACALRFSGREHNEVLAPSKTQKDEETFMKNINRQQRWLLVALCALSGVPASPLAAQSRPGEARQQLQ